MTALFEKIYAEPNLPVLLKRLNAAMQEEQTRREAFYDWIDENTKAEFINGNIVVHSPAKEKHTLIRERLSTLLNIYVELNELGAIRGEKAMIHLVRNSYEPDICFCNKIKAADFNPEMSLYPAPDWVAEILSKKTKTKDRGIKFDDYALNGIAEYWIIDPDKAVIEQYSLTVAQPAQYTLLGKWNNEHDILSQTVTGFKMPVLALFDAITYRQTLRKMIV